MGLPSEVSRRDLRTRSKDIMDAVERGESFTITRDGRPMGQLVPLRRRFVAREQFVVSSQQAAAPSLTQFRADQDLWYDVSGADDPYGR